MDAVLGLLGLVAFILCVIGVASGVTFGVVKLFPAERAKKTEPAPTAPAE